MSSASDRLRRFAVTVLARRRGELRAIQDVRRLAEVARIAGVFAATMLLPIGFLAFLALSSIRSAELSLDADLQARARVLTTQLGTEIAEIFGRFEAASLERLRRGESPTSNLGELSPYLRAAFRFDSTGALAAPFALPDPMSARVPSVGWQRAERHALALERSDPSAAVLAWRHARTLATESTWIGTAMLGEARALHASGRVAEADLLLGDLFSDHAAARDERGFRFGDLARLERARQRIGRAEFEMGEATLIELIEGLLQNTWTIGEHGEPAVIRESLRLLEGRTDPDWLARSRRTLNDRQAQLHWAELVQDEIELVYSRVPVGEFRYLGARLDSPGVWAIVRTDQDFYAFSFSAASLFDDLRAAVSRTNDLEAELAVHLYLADETVPGEPLTKAPLGPWLPAVLLAVEPRDAVSLERSKNRRRWVRIAIVSTAVFVAVVGAFWVARLIAGEVETARQRADFAANVSHELRSPITQIRLKGEALQLGLVEPGLDMQQHFDAIVRESERLSRLVDNVLDFAAIERGAKRYHLRPDDLGGAVLASVESARAAFEAQGMEIEVVIEDGLPRLWLDRDAMGQVITNLLSNAAKYAQKGKWVGVHVRTVRGGVELAVSDRGMGISAAELPRIFDDFFRSTNPEVRRTKGTGIGLAIVRYIVEAHGGTIGVDSAPNRGARFVVTLPLEPPEGAGENA